jgi:hypothetical protein
MEILFDDEDGEVCSVVECENDTRLGYSTMKVNGEIGEVSQGLLRNSSWKFIREKRFHTWLKYASLITSRAGVLKRNRSFRSGQGVHRCGRLRNIYPVPKWVSWKDRDQYGEVFLIPDWYMMRMGIPTCKILYIAHVLYVYIFVLLQWYIKRGH